MNPTHDIKVRIALNLEALEQIRAGFEVFMAKAPYLSEVQRNREQARFDMAVASLEQDRRFLAEELAEVEAAAGYWSMPGTPLNGALQ